MISEDELQAPMWSYQVNLDKRVRDDHPLQRINRALDLGFVRRQVASNIEKHAWHGNWYGRCGNELVQEIAFRTEAFHLALIRYR